MKCTLLALLGAVSVSEALVFVAGPNPVGRVVQLLKSLSQDVEEELKHEEDLFDTFRCWGKGVISAKSASNEKARSRLDSLKAYVADLDAGRIELTTERVDLEKELSGLNADIETAEALRSKEHADFEAAKSEMTKAVAALAEAVKVLEESTAPKAELLVAIKGEREEGFGARVARAQALESAIEVGRRFLSHGDALFLQRVLTGEVPEVDWKKLNREAEFKKSYKARSGDIQKTLRGLLQAFSKNLDEAQQKEAKTADLHTTLITAKKDQKSKAEEALSKMELESGARGTTKAQAEEEIAALTTQVENDTEFIADTQTAMDDKTKEWSERKTVRTDELKAIGEAIALLHSDDARDLFKRSHASQGYSFMQEGRRVVGGAALRVAAAAGCGASKVVRDAAFAAGDDRLVALAGRLSAASGGHFDAVLAAIDTMVATLKAEETTDLTTKEACESDRAADSRSAILAGRSIDDVSDAISKLRFEVAELESQISDKNKGVAEINAQVADATKDREAERADWARSDKDDQDAEALVKQAATVMETFYASKAALVQATKKKQTPEVAAGQAPPPPPSTWADPYSGKQKERKGVSAILEMVAEDIAADRAAAKASEDKAQEDFDKMKTESEAQTASLNAAIAELEGSKGKKQESISDNEKDRTSQKGALDATLAKIQAAASSCDFFTVNFTTRTSNRHLEIHGLEKAKAILNGAVFESGTDAGRELTPGDALVQRGRAEAAKA